LTPSNKRGPFSEITGCTAIQNSSIRFCFNNCDARDKLPTAIFFPFSLFYFSTVLFRPSFAKLEFAQLTSVSEKENTIFFIELIVFANLFISAVLSGSSGAIGQKPSIS